MKENEFSFLGSLSLWAYKIGHSCLLLRRVKSAEHSTRVDVLFKSVRWICLPSTIDDLQVSEVSDDTIKDLVNDVDLLRYSNEKVFKLHGKNNNGYVLASVVFFHEDTQSYSDPSYFEDFQ